MSGFVVRADGFAHIPKDPDAELTYTWDWTKWMEKCGVTSITDATITPDPGITKVGLQTISGGLVAQKFAGGTPGKSYKAVCHATFGPSTEIDDRTIVLDINQR